ncbi:MAG TPA: hypothetical protein ENK57_24820 [Polyangiaceae bacterium]|nr:hypothetical protein [Polyangiaceae bacterium]
MLTRRDLSQLLVVHALAASGCAAFGRKAVMAGMDRFPPFPSPPPEPAASLELPTDLLIGTEPEELFAIYDRLVKELEAAGFDKWSLYAYEDGFAMVTRWEQFEKDDGLPSKRRFPARQPKLKRHGFGFEEHVEVLYNAPDGYYRLFAFLVRGEGGEPTGEIPIDGGQVGDNEIPFEVGSLSGGGRSVTVNVYTFRRRGSGKGEPVDVGLDAETHLVAAGLFTKSELGS